MLSKMRALAGIVTVVLMAAMLTPVYAVYATANLVHEDSTIIGTVTVDVVGTDIVVTYTITAADWYLLETHVSVATALSTAAVPVPGPVNRGNNPKIGNFRFQTDHDLPLPDGSNGVQTFTYTIHFSDIGFSPISGTTYHISVAAHADTGLFAWGDWDLNPATDPTYGLVLDKTAWGEGTGYSGSNWAMYITFDWTAP